MGDAEQVPRVELDVRDVEFPVVVEMFEGPAGIDEGNGETVIVAVDGTGVTVTVVVVVETAQDSEAWGGPA